MSHNKRKQARQAVNIACWLRNVDASEFIEAYIRDISLGGVRVVFRPTESISDTVDLYMTRDGKIVRRCHVAWRQANTLGLMFVGKKTTEHKATSARSRWLSPTQQS
jgi:hypothetical protein